MVNRIDYLNKKAQYLSTDILKKFILIPSPFSVLANKIKGLRKLNNRLYWKEFFRLQYLKYKSNKAYNRIMIDRESYIDNSTAIVTTINTSSEDSDIFLDDDSLISLNIFNYYLTRMNIFDYLTDSLFILLLILCNNNITISSNIFISIFSFLLYSFTTLLY